MIRVLVLISIAGFLAGAVALGAAFALAGPELAARNWNWTIGGHDWSGDGDRPNSRIETVAEPDADDSRELAWDGSTHAAFALPASIEYVQGAGA